MRQFIAQADGICRKANAQLASSNAKANGKEGAALAPAIVENETIEQKAAGELARLTPPAELAVAWTKILGYRRVLANQLGDFAAALRRGEKKFPALAASKKKLHAQLGTVAGKAGLADCGKLG